MSSCSSTLALVGASALSVGVYLGYLYAQKAQASDSSQDNDVENIIKKRRTIQPATFDPIKKVPDEVIHKMLEAATWAPNHGKTEPWKFVVFSGEKSLKKLGDFEAQTYIDLCKKPEAKAREGQDGFPFVEKKCTKKRLSKSQSSHVFAICMERQESEKIPEIEEVEAVAIAVQNMHLVATKYNVGCYWSTGPAVYTDEIKEYLGLTKKDMCLGMFCVGVPTKKHPTGSRKSFTTKTRFVKDN